MKSNLLKPVLYGVGSLALLGATVLVAQEMPLKEAETSTVGREASPLTPDEVARRRAEKDATIAAIARAAALDAGSLAGATSPGKLADPFQSGETGGDSPMAIGNREASTRGSHVVPVDTSPEKAQAVSTIETGPAGLTAQEQAKRAAIEEQR